MYIHFPHLHTGIWVSHKNKDDDPIFSLVKMVAYILVYTISKSGTVFDFENFLIGFILVN